MFNSYIYCICIFKIEDFMYSLIYFDMVFGIFVFFIYCLCLRCFEIEKRSG